MTRRPEVRTMLRRSALASYLVVALIGAGCNGPTPPANPRNVEPPSTKPADRPAEQPAATPPAKPPEKPPEKPVDKPPPPPPAPTPPSPPANPAMTLTKEAGVIRGAVRWTGKSSPRFTEGGLADALVWIAAPPPVSASPVVADETVRITLRKGEYRPHASAARVGAKVQLVSLDAEGDFYVTGAAAYSGTLNPGDPPATVKASNPGWVEIHSQIHPERAPAYLRVLPHSFVAVTGPDGRFQLPAVPPGEYEIVFWHEGWPDGDPKTPPDQRTTRMRVKLDAGAGASLEWTLPKQ